MGGGASYLFKSEELSRGWNPINTLQSNIWHYNCIKNDKMWRPALLKEKKLRKNHGRLGISKTAIYEITHFSPGQSQKKKFRPSWWENCKLLFFCDACAPQDALFWNWRTWNDTMIWPNEGKAELESQVHPEWCRAVLVIPKSVSQRWWACLAKWCASLEMSWLCMKNMYEGN